MRAVIVCTSSYAISAADINSLEVVANVSVTATDFSGNAVDAVGTTVVSLDQVRRTLCVYSWRVHVYTPGTYQMRAVDAEHTRLMATDFVQRAR